MRETAKNSCFWRSPKAVSGGDLRRKRDLNRSPTAKPASSLGLKTGCFGLILICDVIPYAVWLAIDLQLPEGLAAARLGQTRTPSCD
jgi:hypothetical protein